MLPVAERTCSLARLRAVHGDFALAAPRCRWLRAYKAHFGGSIRSIRAGSSHSARVPGSASRPGHCCGKRRVLLLWPGFIVVTPLRGPGARGEPRPVGLLMCGGACVCEDAQQLAPRFTESA
eukprot:scaffold8850_cov134-Isochrysis_galbana.AAC.21